MPEDIQPGLLEIPEQPPVEKRAVTAPPRLRTINRAQTMMANIYVDELISADHKARAIWDLTGRFDLSRFSEPLKSRQGAGAGRPAWDPRLMVSIWVYAYSEGISSAREIERLMEWEPGLQWLGGLETVNHHTLSDFRVEHREALNELFVQLLGLLQRAGVMSLDRVMHDGTKIRAQAGADSFRREKTLREHLAEARQLVASMGDPREDVTAQQKAGRERARRERRERLEQALKEWDEIAAEISNEKEKEQLRVSESEPEAQRMKHGDNAIVPSYNAQLSTEAQNKFIVGVHLSQSSSDAQSLMPAIGQIEQNLGREPSQMVVDGGFTNRANIEACADQKIDLVGSLPDPEERSEAAMKAAGIHPDYAPHKFVILQGSRQLQCPNGCVLNYVRQSRKRGDQYHQYQARGEDCQACPRQAQCCPRNPERGRTVSLRISEQEDVAAFRNKMAQPEYKSIYRQRAEVAEFPNAWIKEKLGVRKFRVFGMLKAGAEMIWACLTYNIMQWLRIRKLRAASQPAGH